MFIKQNHGNTTCINVVFNDITAFSCQFLSSLHEIETMYLKDISYNQPLSQSSTL